MRPFNPLTLLLVCLCTLALAGASDILARRGPTKVSPSVRDEHALDVKRIIKTRQLTRQQLVQRATRTKPRRTYTTNTSVPLQHSACSVPLTPTCSSFSFTITVKDRFGNTITITFTFGGQTFGRDGARFLFKNGGLPKNDKGFLTIESGDTTQSGELSLANAASAVHTAD